METLLRNSLAGTGGINGATGPRAGKLVPARATERGADNTAAANSAASPAPLRNKQNPVSGALQGQVARAQQALDYLDRVASQLEALKGELSARLSGSTNGGSAAARQQGLESQVRQLAATLDARRKSAGAGVDANLEFSGEPANQRFRIRGLDVDSLQQSAPQSLAFSVGSVGGPQLAVTIEAGQSGQEIARTIDRALAPMGVRAGLDDKGALVFSTPESNWPAVKDSIAVSGRGRVTTEEAPPSPAPRQWNIGGGGDGAGNADALRQSLREVVQALERVRRSQQAASNALSSATVEVAAAQTPPPEVELAAEDFSTAAAGTDYDSLLTLTSALAGVSRERVLALLGLR